MVSSKNALRGMQLIGCMFALISSVTGCGSDDDGPAGSGGEGGASGESGEGGASGSDDGGSGEGGSGEGGASGEGGMGGEGGSGTDGPITAPDMTWTWVDFPDSFCRDGSTAGVAVSLNPESDKVMIFMQGGGACFNFLTCGGNPANANEQKKEITTGLLNRTHPDNPVADWNFVFVPYCTGDVHLGTNEDGMIESVAGVQKFVGRRNIEAYLKRVVPTFPDATQVLLTGVSAGGFGAAANMELVQEAFGDIPVTAIDDSGPPMSSEFLAPCLQEQWRTTWGFDESILKDCGEDCPDPNDYSIPYSVHVANKYPDRMGGLIETTGDAIITFFYGYGANDCGDLIATPVPAETFEMGLLDYRQRIIDLDANLGTFYIEGTGHTHLGGNAMFETKVGDVLLVDWVRDIIEGTAAAHVGP